MPNRDFSDSVKLEVVKNNLEKNAGNILCETCGKKIVSMSECRFDHILPFAKGGKSTLSNCQILCMNCNLKKNDRLLGEFIIEEKARKFLAGESILDDNSSKETMISEECNRNKSPSKLSKDEFDRIIKEFIEKKVI